MRPLRGEAQIQHEMEGDSRIIGSAVMSKYQSAKTPTNDSKIRMLLPIHQFHGSRGKSCTSFRPTLPHEKFHRCNSLAIRSSNIGGSSHMMGCK